MRTRRVPDPRQLSNRMFRSSNRKMKKRATGVFGVTDFAAVGLEFFSVRFPTACRCLSRTTAGTRTTSVPVALRALEPGQLKASCVDLRISES